MMYGEDRPTLVLTAGGGHDSATLHDVEGTPSRRVSPIRPNMHIIDALWKARHQKARGAQRQLRVLKKRFNIKRMILYSLLFGVATLVSVVVLMMVSWSQFVVVPGLLLSLPVQTSWRLLITPKTSCSEDPPFVALGVVVDAADFERRNIVRSTWGGIGRVLDRRVRVFFVLGTVPSRIVQEAVEKEARDHGDILQHAAPDKYTHLTFKVITLFRWLAKSCSEAKFLVKADTDIFVDLKKIIAYLITRQHEQNVAAGLVKENIPVERAPSHRNYQDPGAYPSPVYPPYMSGPCYILSSDLVAKISAIAMTLPRLSNEDCFVGLCLQSLGVAPQDSAPSAPMNVFFDGPETVLEFMKWAVVHPIHPARLPSLWKAMPMLQSAQ